MSELFGEFTISNDKNPSVKRFIYYYKEADTIIKHNYDLNKIMEQVYDFIEKYEQWPYHFDGSKEKQNEIIYDVLCALNNYSRIDYYLGETFRFEFDKDFILKIKPMSMCDCDKELTISIDDYFLNTEIINLDD